MQKAKIADCGLFAQAAKRKQAQGPITEFINTHGATEISLEKLVKQAKTKPVEYGESFSMAEHRVKKNGAEKPFLERFLEHDKKLNGVYDDTEEMVISAGSLKDRLASGSGVTTLTPYKGGSKTAGLLGNKLHKNAEFADKVLTEKDLLG